MMPPWAGRIHAYDETEYSEFQRRRPDLPQGNLWGLSQDELEKIVAAFQLERQADADVDMSDPVRPTREPQIH
jgi:hypothetical protein